MSQTADTVREREILPPGEGAGYDEVRNAFTWHVPQRFNIGWDVCGRHAANPAVANQPALFTRAHDGGWRTHTFAEMWRDSGRLAAVLAGRGFARGDRFAIMLPQSQEVGLAHIAAYRLGLIAIPLTVLFRREALRYRLADSGAKGIVLTLGLLPMLAEILPELPALETVLVVDDTGAGLSSGARGEGWLEFHEALGQAHQTPELVDTAADEPALIIYTSGTTGNAKGALHAHHLLIGHLPGFELSQDFFPMEGDCFYTPADWAWIGGLFDALLATWHYGKPIVAYAPTGGFDPERMCRVMAENNVRNAFIPPTALKMMAQVPGLGATPGLKLRAMMSGGEALSADTLAWAERELGVRINEIYGQTEMNYLVGNCTPLWPVRPGSMGRAYPGHEVAVVDEDGRPLPTGEMGEVAVRKTGPDGQPNPVFFKEYWNNPEATAAKFIGEWGLSGDLAVMDDAGYLWFKGRKDDVIISAGYRIGPSAIEEALLNHPAVALAAVIGAPDPVRGEVVKAFIRPAPGATPNEELARSIQDHVKETLSLHEYPRAIEFVEEFPLTPTGKIRRLDLRQREQARQAGEDTHG